MNERLRRVWPFLFVAAAVFVLLVRALLGGEALVAADGIYRFLPWWSPDGPAPTNPLLADQYMTLHPMRRFFHERILSGDFPLWNPMIACGVPFLASMQAALLYPVNLLLSPIDPFYSAGLAAFLKLLMAGCFTILYLRRLGASREAAALSGTAFSLSGFMIVWLGHPQVNGALLLPLFFYLIHAGLDSPGRWCAFSAATASVFLGGHPPTAVHVLLAAAAYAVYRESDPAFPAGARARRLAGFLGAIAVGVLLSAPQLLPFFEYYGLSSSAAASASLDRSALRLPPAAGIGLLLPLLGGSPAAGFESMGKALGYGLSSSYNERTAVIGVVALFLALFAAFRPRGAARFHSGLALFALAGAFGVPPLPLLFGSVPVLDAINPMRLLLFVCFSGAVLAGLGLDAARAPSRGLSRAGAAFLGAAAAAGAAGFYAVLTGAEPLPVGAGVFLTRQAAVFLGGLVVVAGVCFRPAFLKARHAGLICLVWTASELLWAGFGFNPTVGRERYYPETPAIALLRSGGAPFRVIGGWQMPANTAMAYGIQDARGRDFMSLRRYEELITGKIGDFLFFEAAESPPPALRLLNARYVLGPKGMRLPAPRFSPVYDAEISVLEDRAHLPRAFPVFKASVESEARALLARVRAPRFDPRAELLLAGVPDPLPTGDGSPGDGDAGVTIVRYEPDAVELDARMPRAGWVLLLDSFYPGWRAEVNGAPARVLRADYAFRAVAVPAGRSRISMRYAPATFTAGLWLAGIGAALLAAVGFVGARRFKRDAG
jgi:hypothetical protein